MKCPWCGEENDGRYGARGYCNKSCSRAGKNSKIRVTLKGTHRTKRELRVCVTCKKPFEVIVTSSKTHCGDRCSKNDPRSKEKLSKARIKAIQEGRTNHKSVHCSYPFKGEGIRCESKLEYACLDWFEHHYDVITMGRSAAVIEYDDDGQTRRYLPDFDIVTTKGPFIVECKGQIYSQSLSEKWYRYRESAPLKKKALHRYAEESGVTAFWFDKDTPGSRYRKIRSEDIRLKVV